MRLLALLAVFLLAACTAKESAHEQPVAEQAEAYEYAPPPAAAPRSYEYVPEEDMGPGAYESYAEEAYSEEYAGRAPAAIAEPEPTTPPLEVPSELTFNDVMSQLMRSSFGYTVPQEMNIDEEAEVRLVVNPSKDEAEIRATLPEGQITVGTIQVSQVLVARLSSNDFDVTPISPERQALDRVIDTTWIWRIKPKRAGPDRQLHITTFV